MKASQENTRWVNQINECAISVIDQVTSQLSPAIGCKIYPQQEFPIMGLR